MAIKPLDTLNKDTEQAVALPKAETYVRALMTSMKEDFKAANPGLDLDFVRMGSWLVTNKKGQFKDKDNDEIIFGDYVDVVVGGGEEQYMLWGKEGSPEANTVLLSEPTEELALQAFDNMITARPELADRYDPSMITGRYTAYVVPMKCLEEAVPTLYLLSMSPTSKFAFGTYSMGLFKGKFAAGGIPARTAVSAVVTRVTAEEQINQKKQSYMRLAFTAVELLDVSKLGI